ncbi:MAG TPA: hypothetical protein VI072_29410 [Polyangiaceae bacterium]
MSGSTPDGEMPLLYQAFVETLPAELSQVARELPWRLNLARPTPASWGEAFPYALVLTAPELFAEALPNVPTELVRNATLAHMLGVLEMAVIERGGSAAIPADVELRQLAPHLAAARGRAFARLGNAAERAYDIARAEALAAIAQERLILPDARPATLADYRRIARAKHAVFACATLLLAQAAGTGQRESRVIDRALYSVWIAVRLEHDVFWWEREWRGGAAWVVSLARGLGSQRRSQGRATEPDLLRRAVLSSGVLHLLLGVTVREFRCARRRACALGAGRVSAWATAREQKLAELLPREGESAGYVVRWQKLAPWALEVFR